MVTKVLTEALLQLCRAKRSRVRVGRRIRMETRMRTRAVRHRVLNVASK
jgi:hypothetical protein